MRITANTRLIALLSSLSFIACESVAVEVSGFDVDDDGWTITGDAQASSVKPDFNGMGGNPGGLICADDDVTGGVWYFNAPARYLGDRSDTLGGSIRFDVKITELTDPFDDEDVILESGAMVIVSDSMNNPGTDWTSYAVPLSAAAWTLDSVTGRAVTDDELKAVLANVTRFGIRGEFNTGPDTGCLDNMSF